MTDRFGANSRYVWIDTAERVLPDGTRVVYLLRRFVPQPGELADLQLHTVAEGERLDRVAASYLSDPEQFWRICDANAALRPDDLMEPGRVLRITLPHGFPGVPDA